MFLAKFRGARRLGESRSNLAFWRFFIFNENERRNVRTIATAKKFRAIETARGKGNDFVDKSKVWRGV